MYITHLTFSRGSKWNVGVLLTVAVRIDVCTNIHTQPAIITPKQLEIDMQLIIYLLEERIERKSL